MDWATIEWQQWLFVIGIWAVFIFIIWYILHDIFSFETPPQRDIQSDVRHGGEMDVTNGESDERDI